MASSLLKELTDSSGDLHSREHESLELRVLAGTVNGAWPIVPHIAGH
jgi:hypothetical protein